LKSSAPAQRPAGRKQQAAQDPALSNLESVGTSAGAFFAGLQRQNALKILNR
jgi:hypothetical protein